MSRIEQVNELLRIELSNLIAKESLLENGLITISYVDCSHDLKTAKIGVSVLPENFSGTALKKLRQSSSAFSNRLRKKIKLKIIPRFTWLIDSTERRVEDINDTFLEINKKDNK
jgi:ribosome-binding factor A